MSKEDQRSGARRALFVPTGHYDLDRLRIDGIATWSPWYKAAAGGAAAGLTLVFTVLVLYLVFALFAAGVAAVQFDWAVAQSELMNSMMFAAEYARYAWLSSIAMAVIGVAYALLHRWTVANGHYLRLGPWEVGFDTLFAAVAGYVVFSLAAAAWEPLGVVHAWLFWAWGPVFAWVLARLQEVYVLWMVRPDWALSVESAVRVLLPRRFGCDASRLRVEVDDQAHAVTVYAPVDAGEAIRARELIQAIPETRAVKVEPLPKTGAAIIAADDEDSPPAAGPSGGPASGGPASGSDRAAKNGAASGTRPAGPRKVVAGREKAADSDAAANSGASADAGAGANNGAAVPVRERRD